MSEGFLQRVMGNSGLNLARIAILLNETDCHYKRYYIPQKTKMRQIEEPDEQLMALQRAILIELSSFPLTEACLSKPGLGIKDNAAMHLDAKHLLRVDIKRCYQSITQRLCEQSLTSSNWDSTDILEVLPACLVTYHRRKVLPTGAPTSPLLCNIALSPLDRCMVQMVPGYRYTRYLDDLIFSTTEDTRDWSLLDRVYKALKTFGLQPNYEKSRWYSGANDPMRVTGVSITNKASAPREIKRLTRARIYSLAKDGKKIDNITRGYLAHIKDIDPAYYLYMMDYYKRKRVMNVSTDRLSTGAK